MEKIFGLGRWIFPLSFLLYVGLHFGQPQIGADMVPDFLPFPLFWNYATGICILTFIISALTGIYDRLATALMVAYVLLTTVLIHIPQAAVSEQDMINIFRNIMVIGALMVYGRYATRSGSVGAAATQ